MNNNSKTVLIIDDDVEITKTFARIIQKNGYNTDVALTGKEALEKASAKFYDVALIDICLPDMNGTELLDKLVNHDKIIKIIITGFPTMITKGADACFVKPVRPQELLALIQQKLNDNNQ
jgi:DNA-binding response OmpR family regulator